MRQGRPSEKEYPQWQERRRRAAEIFEAGGRSRPPGRSRDPDSPLARSGQAEVVQELGVSPQTASRWQRAWQEGGREKLGEVRPPGPAPLLGPEQLGELGQELLKGAEHHGYATSLWTLSRMAELIERLFGVRHHPCHVWYILRKMGWSCQRPQRRAKERDEAAITRWVKEDWPRTKRGPSRKGP